MSNTSYDPRAAGSLCDSCPLGGPGIKPNCVPPDGPASARIAIVGEAPGKNELVKGRGFVGAAGIKLDEILWHAGVRRAEVFISNACLCRLEVPNSDAADRFSAEAYMKWVGTENKARKKAAKAAKQPYVPMLSPFEACRPRLLRELKWLDDSARAAQAPSGVVVVPMGNFALKSLRGVTGIMKYRGSVLLPRTNDFTDL